MSDRLRSLAAGLGRLAPFGLAFGLAAQEPGPTESPAAGAGPLCTLSKF